MMRLLVVVSCLTDPGPRRAATDINKHVWLLMKTNCTSLEARRCCCFVWFFYFDLAEISASVRVAASHESNRRLEIKYAWDFFSLFYFFWSHQNLCWRTEGIKTGCAVTGNGTKQGVRSLHPTHCDSAFYRHLYYDDKGGGRDGSGSKGALDWLKLLRSSRNTAGFFECSAESVIRSACCLIAPATQCVTFKLNLVNSDKVMWTCTDLQAS